MANKKDANSSVRDKIEQRMKQQEEEHKRDLLKRRLELARNGSKLLEQRKASEAVQSFRAYFKILEEWKGVQRGALSPHLFDVKTELNELILISGVYWDLVKVFDHAGNKKEHVAEFKQYLDKYILFSKGFSYQPIAAEALRKYIRNGKAVHSSEFKSAYTTLTGEKCFIATSLMDVCELDTLPSLRGFRDHALMKSWIGRAFVRSYYRCGPMLARFVNHLPETLRRGLGSALDFLALFVAR